MSYNLEPLKSSLLTNMEFGQLMKRHLSDLASIDQALLTVPSYSAYLQQIASGLIPYEKGLTRVHKNEETEKISQADIVRNKAVVAFAVNLKLYQLSDDPAEVDASRILRILYKSFKNPTKLNYEAESITIDKLVGELEGVNYADKVAFLNIGKYVARMKAANLQFKTLFSGRMVAEAMTETYNMRAMRSEMLTVYNYFTAYVLVGCNSLKTPLFISSLSLLNTARNYYSDILARRKKDKPAPEPPSAKDV